MANEFETTVSVADPAPEPETVDVLGPTGIQDPKIAQERAMKYHRGLGQESPGVDRLFQSIVSGHEQRDRELEASRRNLTVSNQREELVKSYLASRPPGAATLEDLSTIRSLTGEETTRALMSDPKTVFEQQYAKSISGIKQSPIVEQAKREVPQEAQQAEKGTHSIIVGREIALKLMDEVNKEKEARPFFEFDPSKPSSKFHEFMEHLVPFRQWYNVKNALNATNNNPFLKGNSMAEQAMYYYGLPDSEKEGELRKAVDYLKSQNLGDAEYFLNYLFEPSVSKQWIGNLESMFDVATTVPLSAAGVLLGAAAKSRRVSRANKAIQEAGEADIWTYSDDIIKGTDGARTLPETQVLENVGELHKAAALLAVNELERLASQSAAVGSFEQLRAAAPMIFNPWGTVRQANALSAEATQRIVTAISEDTASIIRQGILEANAINRLERGSPELKAAIDKTLERSLNEYNFLHDAIIGIAPDNVAATPFQRITQQKLTAQLNDYLDLIKRKTFLEREIRGIAESPEVTTQFKSGYSKRKYDNLLAEQAMTELQIQSLQRTAERQKLQMGQSRKFRDLTERRDYLINEIAKAEEMGVMRLEDEKLFDALKAASARTQAIANEMEGLVNNIGSFPKAQSNLFSEYILNPDRTLVPNVNYTLRTDPLANVDYVVLQLGTTRGEMFASKEAAENQAKNFYKISDYRIRSQGDKYYIEIQKAIDETAVSVRNMLQSVTVDTTPTQYFGTIMGGQSPRSARYLMPENIAMDRQTATLGASALHKVQSLIKDKTIGVLRKEERKNLVQFADSQRRYVDPVNKQVGRFSTDQPGFEIAWKDMHGKYPTERETYAYWSYVRDYNMDLVMRNFTNVKEKMRMGSEMFDVPINGVKGKPWLEGKLIDRLPPRAEEFDYIGALIVDGKEGAAGTHRNLKFITTGVEQKLLDEGYKIIQLSPYAVGKLRKAEHLKDILPDRDITYMFVKQYDSAPLEWMQIPSRPGGHIAHVYNYYVRVPEVKNVRQGKHVYYGDNNLAGFMDEASAIRFTEAYNTAIDLLAKHRTGLVRITQDQIEQYLQRHLPAEWDWKTFNNLFDKSKGGIYNLETKALMTRRDASSFDSGLLKYEGLVNASDNPHNLYNNSITLKYALERGQTLDTVERVGSVEAPTWRFKEAPLMDVNQTLERAGQNLMRGRYMDDLKIKSTEHFIAEFGDLIDAPIEVVRANPFQHIFDPVWRTDADVAKVAAAKNFRRATLELLGHQPEFAKLTGWVKERIANDFVHNVFGEKAFSIAEPWLLHRLHPIDRMKSLVFYEKMGLWNPLQLFRQAHIVAHTAFVSGNPASFARGYSAGMYSQALGFSDNVAMRGYISQQFNDFIKQPMKEFVTEPVGKKFVKTGWEDHHFIEAHEGLKRSGFMNVGREVADIGDLMTAKLGSTTGVMDNSLMAYKRGEQIGRRTGWFVAYDEWRMANPAAVFDNVAQRSVLDRANLLTLDMIQASNSNFQKGVFAVPSQFMPFQIRLWEQMVSGSFGGPSRLTPAEKARVFLYNSAWYGVPTGLGIMTLGVPMKELMHRNYLANDQLRTKDFEQGLDPNESAATQIFWNGLGGFMSKLIMGGNPASYAETFGPGSLTISNDLLSGNKTFYELMLGPTYSASKELVLSGHPIARAVLGSMGYGGGYPLTRDDFRTLASNVTTLNHAQRTITLLNTGEYMSKNRLPVDKLNTWESYVYAMTGMAPQRITDLQRITQNNKDMKAVKDYFEKEYSDNIAKAYKAIANDDLQLGHTYFTRAYLDTIAGGFTLDEKIAIQRRHMPKYETQFKAIMDRYAKQSPEKLKYYFKLNEDLKRNTK